MNYRYFFMKSFFTKFPFKREKFERIMMAFIESRQRFKMHFRWKSSTRYDLSDRTEIVQKYLNYENINEDSPMEMILRAGYSH